MGLPFEGIESVGTLASPEPAAHREMDLDVLPLPARELLGHDYRASVRRKTSSGRVTSAFLSRGCPYSCSFCAAPLSSGRRVRRFSPDRITKELGHCAQLRFNSIIFYDDCLFVASKDLDVRVAAFVEAITKSSWTGDYQLELRCDAVMKLSEESLSGLKSSGCRQINMGIEKGQASQLNLLRKRLAPDVAADACQKVSSAGIRAAGTFIIGGAGEKLEDLTTTVDFAVSLDLD